MTHLPNLIQDLGIILMTAAVVTLLFKKLKQPVVLGYLLAGFLLSPKFPFFFSVKDTANISIWAEIGVIFMLFGLGLEFSFKKLTKVGKSASITASFEILSMLGVGFICGKALGWSTMDSLFLGGILSISSTTIIVRAFEELGLKGRNFVSLVFGVLIVEDLIAILLLVLLSSVAVTQSLSGPELAFSSLRLVFFLVLWFLLGIYLLPVLLKKFRDYLSNETTLIVSLGLCLMMVIIASQVGFSPALGAFVMGSILAETREGQRIEHLILPVKDLFSAVFFVSVGMLIDLNVVIEYFWVILLMTVVTIVGKLISSAIGAVVSGRSLKNSVQAGMSLAQIGEFSFIIATLGMTLKVTSDFLYPIAVAVSAATTFTTPYLIKYADPFYAWLEKKLPNSFKESLQRYETAMATSSGTSTLSLIWREYGVKIALNSVIVIAISLAMARLALPRMAEAIEDHGLASLLTCLMTLAISGPFLWAIFFGGPSHKVTYQGSTANQLRNLQIGVAITRFLLGCCLAGFVVSNFTSILAFSGVSLIALAALSAFFFSKYSEPVYGKIEKRFLSNLTDKERAELAEKAKVPQLAPWNATLSEFVISPQSRLVAKTLQDARIKEDYGVTVAMIERGSERILAPKRDDLILPGDKIFLIGTDDQLAEIRKVMEVPVEKVESPIAESFGLTSMTLSSSSRFINKTIRNCGLREEADGLIVGIERNGERLLSPDSAMTLQTDDLVWIVGNISKIKALV
ncbi:cation:proton antiporter [Bdellovibrio sp. HCB337]|uniref:cation:proton antiporter domain-containing protein n=1 Tax=Bdellovibrio sp. HCB337 TaxID=3394358 RepID=UPI0039A731D6